MMSSSLTTRIGGGIGRGIGLGLGGGAGGDIDQAYTSSFPWKLYHLLNLPENHEIVNWLPHGKAFRVEDPSRFSHEIVPHYFKHKKISSFQRQLNLYGFRRIVKGEEQGAYFHPLFQKGRKDLLSVIKRVSMKQQQKEQQSNGQTSSNGQQQQQQQQLQSYQSRSQQQQIQAPIYLHNNNNNNTISNATLKHPMDFWDVHDNNIPLSSSSSSSSSSSLNALLVHQQPQSQVQSTKNSVVSMGGVSHYLHHTQQNVTHTMNNNIIQPLSDSKNTRLQLSSTNNDYNKTASTMPATLSDTSMNGMAQFSASVYVPYTSNKPILSSAVYTNSSSSSSSSSVGHSNSNLNSVTTASSSSSIKDSNSNYNSNNTDMLNHLGQPFILNSINNNNNTNFNFNQPNHSNLGVRDSTNNSSNGSMQSYYSGTDSSSGSNNVKKGMSKLSMRIGFDRVMNKANNVTNATTTSHLHSHTQPPHYSQPTHHNNNNSNTIDKNSIMNNILSTEEEAYTYTTQLRGIAKNEATMNTTTNYTHYESDVVNYLKRPRLEVQSSSGNSGSSSSGNSGSSSSSSSSNDNNSINNNTSSNSNNKSNDTDNSNSSSNSSSSSSSSSHDNSTKIHHEYININNGMFFRRSNNRSNNTSNANSHSNSFNNLVNLADGDTSDSNIAANTTSISASNFSNNTNNDGSALTMNSNNNNSNLALAATAPVTLVDSGVIKSNMLIRIMSNSCLSNLSNHSGVMSGFRNSYTDLLSLKFDDADDYGNSLGATAAASSGNSSSSSNGGGGGGGGVGVDDNNNDPNNSTDSDEDDNDEDDNDDDDDDGDDNVGIDIDDDDDEGSKNGKNINKSDIHLKGKRNNNNNSNNNSNNNNSNNNNNNNNNNSKNSSSNNNNNNNNSTVRRLGDDDECDNEYSSLLNKTISRNINNNIINSQIHNKSFNRSSSNNNIKNMNNSSINNNHNHNNNRVLENHDGDDDMMHGINIVNQTGRLSRGISNMTGMSGVSVDDINHSTNTTSASTNNNDNNANDNNANNNNASNNNASSSSDGNNAYGVKRVNSASSLHSFLTEDDDFEFMRLMA